jgi:hypothetical protein
MALKTASEARDVGETKIYEKGTFANTLTSRANYLHKRIRTYILNTHTLVSV